MPKIKCPVCFTKMNEVGHDLVCPVCGYKYCEKKDAYTYDNHNHNDYKSYNQKTSYSSGYQSSAQGTPPTRPSGSTIQNSGSTQQTRTPAQNNYSSLQTRTPARSSYTAQQSRTASQTSSYNRSANAGTYQRRNSARKNSVAKIIITIFVLYFLIYAVGAVLVMAGSFDSGKKAVIQFLSDEFGIEFEPFDDTDSSYDSGRPAERVFREVAPVPDYPFASVAQDTSENHLLRDLTCYALDKAAADITREDCELLEYLICYPNQTQNTIAVQYGFSNDIEGTYESDSMDFNTSELRYFTNLEVLNCYSLYDLSLNPGDLDGLTELYYLACYNTPSEIAEIIDPAQLFYLILTVDGQAMDLYRIDEFEQLIYLNLNADHFESAYKIATLDDHLRTLSMTDYESGTDYFFLFDINNLQSLEIYSPWLITIDFIKNMPSLYQLTVCGSDAALGLEAFSDENAPALTYLDLSTDAGLVGFENIAALKDLEELYLIYTDVDDLSWASGLNNLRIIDVYGSNVTSLAPLSDLPNLENVLCSMDQIEDYGTLDLSLVSE